MSSPGLGGLASGAQLANAAASETGQNLTNIPTQPGSQPAEARAEAKARGAWGDAWYELRRKPLFVISAVLIVVMLLIAAFPMLFTSIDPQAADLHKSVQGPIWGNWFKFGSEGQFGYDVQGQDVYARTIYGARASILVGVIAVIGNMLIGGLFGIISGYVGGWVDTLLARFGDIFLGLPFVLGALVILATFAPAGEQPGAFKITSLVIIVFIVLSWPSYARIMRSAVLSTKQLDYVHAARALGAKPSRIIMKHVLPNSLAPMVVVGTLSLGAYIGAEATLSFLGIGLRDPVVSWGVMISGGRDYISAAPHTMYFPATFLVVTVLSFVMLGDAVRDALDPKLR